MAKLNQEAIDTFIGITGLPDTLAIQILQEYGGDLNRAVNAHFNHGHGAIARGASVGSLQDDFMDADEPVHGGHPSHMLATELHPDSFSSHHTRRREIPIEVKDDNGLPSQSGLLATVEDVSRRPQAQGSEAHGTIVIDDEDDDEMSNVQSAQSVWDVRRTVPSAPVLSDVQDPDVDIEEEMIRAAIEASKKEAEGIYSSDQFNFHNGSEGNQPQIGTSDAQTASSSFEGTLSREHADRERTEMKSPVEHEFPKPSSQSERVEAESSCIQDQPQILENGTHSLLRFRHLVSGSEDSTTDIGDGVVSPPSNPILPHIQQSENGFRSDEWGGISSAEHDEAVMLEAAMFGGIPESSEYNSFAARRIMQSNLNPNIGGPYVMPEPHPPSPTLTAQRQIREQQDDEYFASLQADIEKAEARRLEEQAARDAVREEEKRKEEEKLRKLEEEQELERQLAAKEASIPQEPSADDVNAVNLLVRMPDGSRRGRRFLKSDKIKSLFDYIDTCRVVKPNTYRLVRPYPRRAFGDGDSILTLSELGLTSKQEALYLELI